MQNNNHNDYPQEDRIDLGELFKFLISSKKIIIVITLFITTLGAIYSFLRTPEYKSTALIEIGMYWQDEQTLIEPAEALTKELNINFIYKQGTFDLVIESIEDKLILIAYTSSLPVTSNNLLNEVVRYIENRHSNLLSNLTQKTKNQLTYKIESLNNEIKYSKSTLLSQNEDEKIRITNKIESLNDQIEFSNSALLTQIANKIITLNNDLPNINLKIKALKKIIIEDEANLFLLSTKPDLLIQRASQSPTLNEVIYSYKNQLFDLKAKNTILSKEKDSLEFQLKLFESNDLESDEIFKLSQEKDALEFQLKLFESNDLESDEIFKLSQEKDALEFELEFLMKQNPTSTQLIGEIETNKEDGASKAFYILLSFMFGLFLSIVIVFINASLKTSKEYKS